MTKWSHFALPSVVLLAAAVASGCSPSTTENPAGRGGEVAPPAGGGAPPGALRPIMRRFEKGPDPLWTHINGGLSTMTPNWDALQPQTQSLADLAPTVGPAGPTQRNPETWGQHANAIADAARELNAAVVAHKFDEAKAGQLEGAERLRQLPQRPPRRRRAASADAARRTGNAVCHGCVSRAWILHHG